MFADYETLETHFGNHLRSTDRLGTDEELFFPIRFLDRLFHFAENLSVVENRRNPEIEVNTVGRDFDLWVDNMVANTVISLSDDECITPIEVKLIDIEQFESGKDGLVKAVTASGIYDVLDADGMPLKSGNIEEIGLEMEVTGSFDDEDRPESLEYLASIFIRAAQSMNIDLNSPAAAGFADRLFDYFKYDLVGLVPNLMEDLQLIAESRILKLSLK